MMDINYNFWDDRTHEMEINPCEGCCDYVDGECVSLGGCMSGTRPAENEDII